MSQPAKVEHKSGPRVGGEGLNGKQDAARVEFKIQPMTSAPKDGRNLFLFDDTGHAYECYWRETRQFRKSTWQEIGFWSHWPGPPSRVMFDPKGWVRQSGLPAKEAAPADAA